MSITTKNFKNQNLEGRDFSKANLSECNFTGANLKDANLTGANLELARFVQTDLRGADLRRAILKETSFIGALYDSDTQWPKDFVIEGKFHGYVKADSTQEEPKIPIAENKLHLIRSSLLYLIDTLEYGIDDQFDDEVGGSSLPSQIKWAKDLILVIDEGIGNNV